MLEFVTASKASSKKVWTSFAIMLHVFPFLLKPQQIEVQAVNQFFYQTAVGRSVLSLALTAEIYFLEIDRWNPEERRHYWNTMFSVDTARERYSRTKSDPSTYHPFCVQIKDKIYALQQAAEQQT